MLSFRTVYDRFHCEKAPSTMAPIHNLKNGSRFQNFHLLGQYAARNVTNTHCGLYKIHLLIRSHRTSISSSCLSVKVYKSHAKLYSIWSIIAALLIHPGLDVDLHSSCKAQGPNMSNDDLDDAPELKAAATSLSPKRHLIKIESNMFPGMSLCRN